MGNRRAVVIRAAVVPDPAGDLLRGPALLQIGHHALLKAWIRIDFPAFRASPQAFRAVISGMCTVGVLSAVSPDLTRHYRCITTDPDRDVILTEFFDYSTGYFFPIAQCEPRHGDLSISGPPNFSHFMIDYTNREVVSVALAPTKINCIDRL
jgi:hypothetical protein